MRWLTALASPGRRPRRDSGGYERPLSVAILVIPHVVRAAVRYAVVMVRLSRGDAQIATRPSAAGPGPTARSPTPHLSRTGSVRSSALHATLLDADMGNTVSHAEHSS